MAIDYEYFKRRLEEEKTNLEKELESVGRRNPDNPSDWEAAPADRDVSQADDNTVADSVEDYEENVAIVSTLEARYGDIVSSLKSLEEGKYGLCDVCGEEISHERLEANPAARTCQNHM